MRMRRFDGQASVAQRVATLGIAEYLKGASLDAP
jgi:hypothetical protein